MSVNARKRSSKWDAPQETHRLRKFADDCSWSDSRDAVPYESKPRGWHSDAVDELSYESKARIWHSETVDADRSRWPSTGRSSRRPENFQTHHRSFSRYEEHDAYGSRMSPGLNEWRFQNRYSSPKHDWRRTKKSKSRSNSRGRSRSRSPILGLRRDHEPRTKTKELCRNFAAGRCRRGDQCWFVHEDSEPYEYESRIPSRDWCDEPSIDGFCEFKRDPPSERPSPQSSEVLCKFFAAGRCRNGSTCRFSHGQTPTSPSRWSNHEGTSQPHRLNERETDKKPMGKEIDKPWTYDDVEMSPEWNYKHSSPPAEKDSTAIPFSETHHIPPPQFEPKPEHKTNATNVSSARDEERIEDNEDKGKKSKEAKALRAFKFALAEYVKELMKPKWKEGHMSKIEYKSIVKRAVDKVTHTVPTANVPQTPEKIELYLSASKPKLAKLLQAYVDKSQKDK